MSQEQEAKKSTEAEKHAALYPGMRSEQSIIEERKIDPYAGETPVIPLDSHEKPEFAAAYPGMRAPDRVLDEKARQARIEEDQKGIKESLQDIADEVELEMAKRHARVVQRRQQQTQGHLRNDEMRLVIESMKTGGITPLPTADEAMETVLQDEKALLQETGGIKGVLGRLNRATMAEVDPKPEKQPPNPELLQKPLPAPEVLTAKVDHKKINEYIEAAKNLPTPELITDERFLNDNLADKTPTEILQQLKLNNLIKIEDIEIDTPNGKRIDPTKKEYLINAIRLKSITQREAEKASIKVPEEINTKYKGSRDALDKIRAAIKQNTDAKEDVAAEQKLRGYIDLFRKKVKAEFSRAYSPTAIEDFVLPVAKVFVGELQSELPGITPEEFLAAVSVIESQENVQKASQDFQKKVFEQFNSGIQRKLLDSPLWIKIKREDIVSPAELDALLAEYKRNPTPALEQELAEYTSHTDNREQAIKFYGLSGLIQPRDIRTDNVYEITEAVDNDRSIFFQNAIRLKHIVHDRLNQKVDSIVKAEFGTSPSTSIDAYTKLQAFIAEKNPDATADDKRLLQEYYMGFGEMVNQEIRKQSLIFKDQERVFIDIGKHKATKIPARVVLSTARKVAAERFVRANQAQLPEGMTPEQFLAGMSIADTYRFSEDKLKEEVFDWYRKNKPRQNKDYDEGKESMPRRRIPVPFLRRGQGPTPPETPPAPQPPTGPGNPPDNLPPGGSPLPEPPPVPPSGGGAAAGGAPNPDNQPSGIPDDEEDEDTIQVIVPDDEQELPFDLTEGLPIIPIELSDLNVFDFVTKSEIIDELNKNRKNDRDVLIENIKSMDPKDVLSKFRLGKRFTEQDVKDVNEALIDEILLGYIFAQKFEESIAEKIEQELMNQNPKIKDIDTYFDGVDPRVMNTVIPEFISEVNRFFHSDKFKNSDNPEELWKVERMRVALRLYNEHSDELPKGGSPERFLAVISIYESVNHAYNDLFNELYKEINKSSEEEEITEEQKNTPQFPPLPPAPPRTGGEPPRAQPAQRPKFEVFKEAPTRKGPGIPRRTWNWLKTELKSKPPLLYSESYGFLTTPLIVNKVDSNYFIKRNKFLDRLQEMKKLDSNKIKKVIEKRTLSEIVKVFGLEGKLNQQDINIDNPDIKDSEELLDAIMIRTIAHEVLEDKKNRDIIVKYQKKEIPSTSIRAYDSYRKLYIFPKILQDFKNELQPVIDDLKRSDMEKKDVEKAIEQERIKIAGKLYQDHSADFQKIRWNSPEKFLAALSLGETFESIQDHMFDDLYKLYLDSRKGPDQQNNQNPSGPEDKGPGGSGNSSPPNNRPSGGLGPEPNPSPGGAQVSVEAEPQGDDAVVAQLLEGINLEPQTVSSQEEIQKRLERLAAAKN